MKYMRRLTEEEVKRIRQYLSVGCTHAGLARIFRVSRPTISAIARGETWQ